MSLYFVDGTFEIFRCFHTDVPLPDALYDLLYRGASRDLIDDGVLVLEDPGLSDRTIEYR